MALFVTMGLLLALAFLWGWIAGYRRGWDECQTFNDQTFARCRDNGAIHDDWWRRGEPPPWDAGVL